MAKKNPFLMKRNLLAGKGIAPLKFDAPVMFDPKKAGMPTLFGGKPVYMGQSRYTLAGLNLLKKWKAQGL